MPWDDIPNNKKNNSDNNSPWGEKPKKETFEHNFSKVFSKGEHNFKNIFPNNDGNSKPIIYVIITILVLWLLTGFYQIKEGEEAVILRFGKFVRKATTGLNYHLPEPIETAIKERTGLIRKEEIGGNFNAARNQSNFRTNFVSTKTIPQDNLVLTGDENILDINFVVQWKISNLVDFIFNVSDPKDTVINVAESALREVVGNNTLAKTYTDGRFEVEQEAKKLAQKALDQYKIGVEITAFQLMKVDPPVEVIDAFREVQNAKADKEREINLAFAYRNDLIPRARGQAAKLIQEGQAYKEEVVEKSKGEAERFNKIYEEYKKSKIVTKSRLYIDTMQQIFSGTEKIFIDSKKGNGVVPYLPLPDFNKTK